MNLRLLGRARLRVCLLVVVAASAASLLAAPAASASSFAALLSGSQAGSDQNQNLVWVNSAGSPDVSLRFESALGYWPHMHKIGGRCGSDTARTAGCPASSRIATVAATFSAPGSLPVVRTGYLALADSLSGELRGHDVLLVLDQNSRYKVTVKPIRVELKRVSGQPAAVLDIGTAPRMELASGAVSPARLSALAISGQQRWMRNPTACGTGASITAVATFADGSSESIRRTPNVTGCGSLDFDQPVEVMFNPREYTITKKSNPFEYTHPRATGFNLRVGLGEHADGERVTDARSMRVWVPGKPKYEDIARLPVCDEQAALANACPVGSQVGDFCVEIGPSRETACGALRAKGIIRNTGTGGGKIELLATLSKGGGGGGGAGGVIWVGQASIEESVGNGGVVNGGVVIVLDGLPQADAHAFRLVGDNPLYESSGSCGSNPLHGDLAGWSGAARDMTGVLAVACTPGIETTDAADSDLDGDGIADDPLRPADFDVEFAITDNGDGIDWASVGCQFKGWDGTIKGSTRVDDTDGDGRPDVCRAIRSPSGAGTIEIAASDLDGHVTVLKLGFTVDSDPPAIAIDEPGVHVFDEFPTLFFDVVEEHPGSSLCELISEDEPAGVVFASACSYIDRQTGEICDPGDSSSGDGCKRAFVIPHLIEKSGRYRATITHTDAVGNKGTTSFPFVVDRDPPVLATTNTADADRDGDGFADQRFRPAFFDVFFSATDDGFGVDWVQNTCAVRLLGGALPGGAILSARLVDLDGDGRSDVCRIENAPEGDVEVSISIADGGGHVTVLKLAFTVDTTPPSIAIDEPGVHITGDPDFDLWTALAVTIDGKTDAADLTGYSCKILLEADLDGDGEYEPISHMATGCGGGGGGSGGSLRVLPTVNKITLEVGDAAGNTSSRVIDVYLDADPPSIAIDESGVHITGDPDFDLLFTTDDNSLDVDGPLSASCTRKGWDGTIKGSAKLTKADAGRALNGECSFTGVADGDYEVELMVIDAGGHVTVLKHSMTVDTTPPSIAIDESGVHITGDPDFDLWADLGVTIDGKSDAVDLTDYSCSILHEADLDGDGEFEPISRMTTSCGGGGGGGAGGSLRVLPTVNKITLEVGDAAGNTSSRVIDVYLDADPPSIAIDESGVHITGDPDFDLLFTTDDNSLDVDGPLSASCTRKGWDGTIKGSAKLTKADAGRALNGECSFTGVADGDYEVELMVTDAGGHVTVLKHSMTVDTTPPSIAIDEQGVHFTADSFFDIDFEVDEPHLGIPRCGVATGAGAAAGAARCIDETCASTGDLDGDGLPGFRCRVAGFDEDGERFEIVVTDVLGHHSNAWFDVVLDTTPPSITPVDPLDDDSDGDGFADRRFRPAFFDITYLVADASFADPVARSRGYGSGTCVVTTRSTGTVSTGKIETGAAGDVTCSFEGLPEGDYDVTFSISDAAGNRASRSVGVTVDTTPPAISILSPADGDWIACPAGDDPAATGVVPVKFTLSDSTADIAGVEISFNRGPRQTVSLDGSLQVQTAEMVVDCRELTTGVDVEYRVYATDRAGNQDDQPATVLIDKAPPVLLTIDPRDADSDGDGFADDRLRPPSFELFFDTYEEGSGIAENGISCGLEGPAGKAVKGKIKVIKDSTGGVACQVEDAADGDLFVVVKVADTSGHVTVLKRGFTVDATGPVVTFTGPADADSDGDGVADDPYRTAEFDVPLSFDDGSGSGVDPNRSSCKLVPGGGVVSAAVSGLVDSDGDGSIDSCHVTNAPEGPVALVIVGYDRFGNTGPQAPSKRTWIVDSSPPQLVTSSKGDTDSDGDGVADDPIRSSSFEVAFEASDALSGIDPESPTCSAEYITSIGLPKITPKIAKEHHGKFRCMVEGAQSGPVKVTGTVRDHAGNVVLNRVTFTVDATGPAINLTDPGDADADGDVYADKPDRESRFAIPFSVRNDPDGKAAQTARCVVRGWDPVKKTPILGVADLDGDGAPDACVVEFAPEGEIEIALMVGSGNQTDVIVRKFVIQPPQA